MYITDAQLDDGWQISKKNIDAKDSILANTLSVIGDEKNDDVRLHIDSILKIYV